jgi:hypothetical protein
MVTANDLQNLTEGEWIKVSSFAQLKIINDEITIDPFSESKDHLENIVFNHDLVKNETCKIVIYKEYENKFIVKIIVKNIIDNEYGPPRTYSTSNWRTITSRTTMAMAKYKLRDN